MSKRIKIKGERKGGKKALTISLGSRDDDDKDGEESSLVSKPFRRVSSSFLTESHAADQQGRNDHALDHLSFCREGKRKCLL